MKPIIYPLPKSLVWGKDTCPISNGISLEIDPAENQPVHEEAFPVADRLSALLGIQAENSVAKLGRPIPFQFRHSGQAGDQAYELIVETDVIEIHYGGLAGLFYAMVTLAQIVRQSGSEIPTVRIEDEPDLNIRGIMIDIGRNKIPTMETLYSIVDMLTALKINHLQLYMEGYCFEYETYRSAFPDATPITAAEFRALDRYCKERFIDLVPNQNSLGHMADWLASPRFAHLAETPEGISMMPGMPGMVTTLDVSDPGSAELVNTLFSELLPNFTSGLVNINFDEPFEMGKGKNKEWAEREGTGALFLHFLQIVNGIAKKHGKKTMLWADVIFAHPELLSDMPKDLILLDWNYEATRSFEKNGETLQQSGFPFLFCPGTSAWNSITGRTDNMKGNVADAAINARRFGAQGILLTDWGDMGHWQHLPFSFPGYAYAAACGWQVERNVHAESEWIAYLDKFVFEDRNERAGRIVSELGNYYRFENSNLQNLTAVFMTLSMMGGLTSSESNKSRIELISSVIESIFGTDQTKFELKMTLDLDGLSAFVEQTKIRLNEIEWTGVNGALMQEELRNAIQFLEHSLELYRYNDTEKSLSLSERTHVLERLIKQNEELSEKLQSIWRQRNREGGLARSMEQLLRLKSQYEERIASPIPSVPIE
ncbi:glycoside hydrolase family 20 zincin-like fold domain-containing protein [Bacillus sp. FJAT-28004]|uniref:glycoside hydrolase family 20 zincin-like fold domain-containing protein n=1 Tax=Bacillus sp. FJAT-28004 TaxID=1679165 RepID=UPI001F22DD16|nr:glycoside hydrolase family 20 zincin-like fold domain-containing protein [Bacillus sp. FJAT-28004]